MFLIPSIRSIHAGAINNILAEAVQKTTCVRVYVCVWVCLCVRLSEHVQTPMLKRLRARETSGSAVCRTAFCPTSLTTRPAEYATRASPFDIATFLPRLPARVYSPLDRC